MTAQTGPLRGPLRKRESHLWTRDKADWYVEPDWCSARLFEQERFEGIVVDPACGGGNIVRSARGAGLLSIGSDIVRRSQYCTAEADFLDPAWARIVGVAGVENIVSNPPFGLCDDRRSKTHPFVERAIAVATRKVALLLPANWVQGAQRSKWLDQSPLRKVLFIVPRPSMPPGTALAAGMKPGNGTTDYAWFIWLRGYDGAPEIGWLRRDP